MGVLFKRFKTKFRYSLKPLFAMLVAKQRLINKKEWTALVNKVHESVCRNPSEFLGADLPEPNLLRDVLDEIFQEFLKERVYHDTVVEQKLLNKIFGKH
jgi:hypothetical protein